MRDRERAESKNNNSRQTYCGYGRLPDLDCYQLEQDNSNSRQGFHSHGQLPDREHAEAKNNNAIQND